MKQFLEENIKFHEREMMNDKLIHQENKEAFI